MVVQFVFWGSLALILYVYAGYSIVAGLLSRLYPNPVQKRAQEPFVSILIAAYNEAEVIESTIRNKLLLDYPSELFEILVISDGSDDGTDDIVKGIGDPQVRLLRQEPRAGKTSALNLAVPQAKGSILVFSDANSLYEADALQKLVANFAEPKVGYVTGKMIYVDPDGTMVGDGCSSYMQYENALRSIETRLGSVVGVDGGIDAVRHKLYQPMRVDQLPDFVLPLSVVAQGSRVVYESGALLRETSLKDATDEYRMRVRVSLRALWALWDMRVLLGCSINPLFAWQLWSHKVLRYLCFVFLLSALGSNLLLWSAGGVYRLLFFGQLVCYAGGLLVPALEKQGIRIPGLNFCRYFLLLNIASAHAFCKFICGKKQILWTPRKG